MNDHKPLVTVGIGHMMGGEGPSAGNPGYEHRLVHQRRRLTLMLPQRAAEDAA
jgi:hypothetical protein